MILTRVVEICKCPRGKFKETASKMQICCLCNASELTSKIDFFILLFVFKKCGSLPSVRSRRVLLAKC